MPRLTLELEQVTQILTNFFTDETRKRYAQELVNFVYENFPEVQFHTTGTGPIPSDLRATNEKGNIFFIIARSFKIIVYLPEGQNYDYNFTRNGADFSMIGNDAVNFMSNEQSSILKNYIRLSHTKKS
ncbi:MAG: hypothetical protein J0649_02410 [Methylococcales bacterium]|jgi:hypothetical protein|nr:hypothetical protein [Methylococcales bacterium]